jgi:hypothetical protein
MAQQTELGKQYGGIVIWELSEDAAPPIWLYGTIEEHFPPKRRGSQSSFQIAFYFSRSFGRLTVLQIAFLYGAIS